MEISASYWTRFETRETQAIQYVQRLQPVNIRENLAMEQTPPDDNEAVQQMQAPNCTVKPNFKVAGKRFQFDANKFGKF
jgi:hypothetical protein